VVHNILYEFIHSLLVSNLGNSSPIEWSRVKDRT